MDSLPALSGPRFPWGLVLFSIIMSLAGVLGCGVSAASTSRPATFSWRANPQDDNVIGYRLYYGPSSRFDSGGHLKSGFSYAYYVDFANSQRCRITKSGPVCEPYSANEVQCEGLNTDKPKCTLYGLWGFQYFTMTAYNAQAESAYTRELKSNLSAGSGSSVPAASPGVIGTLHAVYTILLP